ncbi:hypothetical protein ACWIUD_07715 [Helicobacter sp. 23-1044]
MTKNSALDSANQIKITESNAQNTHPFSPPPHGRGKNRNTATREGIV